MRKLLAALSAVLFSATMAFAATTLPLFSGPLPAADLQATLNTLVNEINASAPFIGNTTITASSATPGTQRAVTGNATIASGVNMTSGNLVGVRGAMTIPSGATVSNAADYLYGVQGKVIGGGTISSGNICGVCAQWDYSAGTYSGGVNSVLWLDAGATASASAISTNFGGSSQLLRMTNTTAAITSQLFDIYANATLFMQIDAPSHTLTYFQAAGTGGSSCGVSTGAVAAKVLQVTVAGTNYWIPLCSSNS